VTPLLTDLPAGYVFEPIRFSIDAEKSRAYRAATADGLSIYDEQGAVPPLAVAALALGALLERVGLPPGTLHASESFHAEAPVPVGATVECNARLSQRSQRGGWTVLVLDSEIGTAGRVAVRARATVLTPSS